MGDLVAERMPPDEAFELLAHETRFRVLEVLNEADGGPLGFTELRERVGADDPGGFHYHLERLVDRYVRRAADEDGASDAGYELAPAGRRVVGAVLSGAYTKRLDAEPVPLDAGCLNCGEPMTATLRADGLWIGCRACGVDYTTADVPAGVLEDRPREAVAAVADRWLSRNHATAAYGFCVNCDGRMEARVRVFDVPPDADEPPVEADAVFECRRCGDGWHSTVPAAAVTHPAVAGFHYEHGVDVRETPLWELPWMGAGVATVTAEDPLRVTVAVALDGETRRFTFDADLDLVDAEGGRDAARK